MQGCFGCFGRRRQSDAFLQAVRDGAVSSIATVIEQQPSLAKSTTIIDKKNALHLACEEGHIVVLNAVLEVLTCQESIRDDTDADSIHSILNAQDSRGQTPLFVAAALGHSDCVRLLLTNGADRTIPDVRGNLPLHMSSWWGHLSITFMLLDYMLPEEPNRLQASDFVNRVNSVGLTALHLAVWARRSGILQVLLQHNADISVRSGVQQQPDILLPCTAGSTPLHLAAARGGIEICKLLLKAHYERVVEPLMLDPSSAESVAAAAAATASDPRMQMDNAMLMPYQIAQRMGYTPLATILRPTISLARFFGEIVERHAPRIYGAPSLKSIATEAVNRKLEVTLKDLIQKEEEVSAKRRTPSQLVISAAVHDGGHSSHPFRDSSTALMAAAPWSSSRSQSAAATPSALSPLHPVTPGIDPPSVLGGPPRPSPRGMGSFFESPTRTRIADHAEEAYSLPGMVQDEGDVSIQSEARALSLFAATEIESLTRRSDTEATRNGSLNIDIPLEDSPVRLSREVLSPRTPMLSSAEHVGGACYQPSNNESRELPLEEPPHAGLEISLCDGKLSSEDDDVVHTMNRQFSGGVAKEVVSETEEAQDDEECGICLECSPGIIAMPCEHKLCGACALKICASDFKKPSLCPFCRTLIRDFRPRCQK